MKTVINALAHLIFKIIKRAALTEGNVRNYLSGYSQHEPLRCLSVLPLDYILYTSYYASVLYTPL